jgi:hypothetical protein
MKHEWIIFRFKAADKQQCCRHCQISFNDPKADEPCPGVCAPLPDNPDNPYEGLGLAAKE